MSKKEELARLRKREVTAVILIMKPCSKLVMRWKATSKLSNSTDADEQRLLDLTTKPISMGDTSLGRLQTVKKMELHAAVNKMSKGEREELRNKMKVADDMVVDAVPAPTVPIFPNANPNDDQIPPLPSAGTQLFPDDMSDGEVEIVADDINVHAM
jgi:hypothetical protein